MCRVTPVLFWLTLISLAATESTARGSSPSFQRDVMAVLSKSGCNAGACHGNASGKGGLKLSLRGEDPAADYYALTDELAGRRINRVAPAESLLLLKPTADVPHQGGQRLHAGSLEYELLSKWVAAGAPGPNDDDPQLAALEAEPRIAVITEPHREVRIQVTATFSDDSSRDVTPLAVYEPSNLLATVAPGGLVSAAGSGETTIVVRYLDQQVTVRLAFVPARPNFNWSSDPPANYIDRHVYEKLRKLRVQPSAACADEEFVRRAHLDALGIPPTADESRSFAADPRPDKRARLIDSLLDRDEFADRWALKWADVLKCEEKVLDAKGVTVFDQWLRESISQDKPIDQFVREIILARGSTYENPPANYWRANRDPVTRAETTARVFLGVRLQCAKCHSHPFDRWTQDDYYGWAANFAGIDYKIVENKRRDKFDKNEFAGEQIVLVKNEGSVTNPRTGQPAEPRFLGAEKAEPTESDRIEGLASWLTRRDNRRFARMQVNRIWYHIMGRGLVEPIDDFRDTNPPTNPELLDALVDDFIAGDCRIKHLVRQIMNSNTYQASAVPNETNADDQTNYSRAIVRRLDAEQLLDAQSQLLDVAADFNGYEQGVRASEIAGVQRVRPRDKPDAGGDRFLKVFGKPARLLACECERSNATNLSQALTLIGDASIQRRLAQEGNRLHRLAGDEKETPPIIDELFWQALSRAPSEQEKEAYTKYLDESNDRFAALQDIAWAVINSKEFMFRH